MSRNQPPCRNLDRPSVSPFMNVGKHSSRCDDVFLLVFAPIAHSFVSDAVLFVVIVVCVYMNALSLGPIQVHSLDMAVRCIDGRTF